MNKILFVSGEGGHAEQMLRLVDALDLNGSSTLLISDAALPKLADRFDDTLVCGVIREKDRRFRVVKSISVVFALCKAVVVFRPKLLISTGPGIAIPPAIFCRLMGRTVVHIETWSRFRTESISGMVMYRISQYFLVQNVSLLQIYPKAKYVGRL